MIINDSTVHDIDVARWMCQAPAAQTGMRRKGRIEEGYDADFCVFAPDEQWVVRFLKAVGSDPDQFPPEMLELAVPLVPLLRRGQAAS